MAGKDTRNILKALEAQGFTYRRTKRGHLVISKDGRRVTTMAGTPSDHRSWRNALAALRGAGFIWP